MTLDEPSSPKHMGPSTNTTPVPTEAPKTPPAPATPAATPIPPQVEDFDALVKSDVGSFVELGQKIGGLVEEQVRSSKGLKLFHELIE